MRINLTDIRNVSFIAKKGKIFHSFYFALDPSISNIPIILPVIFFSSFFVMSSGISIP
jgi:hypothetical protein